MMRICVKTKCYRTQKQWPRSCCYENFCKLPYNAPMTESSFIDKGWLDIFQYPSKIYLFRFDNRSTRKRCETCSNLTIKTPEWSQWHRTGTFIVNFEHISHLFLLFLLLLWTSKYLPRQLFYRASIRSHY